MTLSSVIIEGFVLKCKECENNACAKRECNGDPKLWCPHCCNEARGRKAYNLVNKLNVHGGNLLQREILPEEMWKTLKIHRELDPKLNFYIERV